MEPRARQDGPVATNAMSPHPFFDRQAKEAQEDACLRSCALHSAHSLGRCHAEEEDDLRTCYERDRDRIVHCTGFRRLMYKTQVFLNRRGDHNRTRLSHTLEVAQVARSLGSSLALNEPLCEALALSHDIGHPPFGHRGEAILDKLMSSFGGFRHNAQVLRVVDLLERRSPDYPGLNLCRELRESLLKHERESDWPAEFQPRPKHPYLEAQVVDLADSTAYNVHDLEDGLREHIFDEPELFESLALWRGAHESVEMRHPGFLRGTRDTNLRIKRITNELLKICINDLIENSARNLEQLGAMDPRTVRNAPNLVIAHSSAIAEEVGELQTFLMRRFYRHPQLLAYAKQTSSVLATLFEGLLAHPEEMPEWYRNWIELVGPERAVCDYLAGMTDRFAEREFSRLTGFEPEWPATPGA